MFLRECSHLSEYIGMLHLGREFSTEVLGKSLKMILDEYGNFNLSKSNYSNIFAMILEPLNCQIVVKDIEMCRYVSVSVLIFFLVTFYLPLCYFCQKCIFCWYTKDQKFYI